MNSSREQLEALAVLFRYPQMDYAENVQNALTCSLPAAPGLVEFAGAINGTRLTLLQELYTSTFDLQPACALDLGWHLFGEEYERGLLLARMRRELRARGIAEDCGLPDHLSHALLLLAKMEPGDAEEFVAAIVAPALERMLKCMPARNLFAPLLRAAQQLIVFHFPAAFEAASPQAEGVTL